MAAPAAPSIPVGNTLVTPDQLGKGLQPSQIAEPISTPAYQPPTPETAAPGYKPQIGSVYQSPAPAGSKLSANGNFYDANGNAYSQPPVTQTGSLTANITTPNSATSTPSAAISSTTAKDDLSGITSTLSELDQNATDHATALGSNAQPTDTPSGDTSNSPDDAINSILSSLDQNLADTQANTDQNSSDVEKAIADTQAQADASAHDAFTTLSSIQNGTYPLSPVEQQLLDATTASFQQALGAQEFANQGALGKMTEILASLGIDKSAPEEAAGLIFNTISEGASKIAAISTKMSTAVGNLRIKMQTQDYNEVSKAYASLAKSFTDRTNALQKLQTDVATAGKNAQTQATNYAKEAITGITNSDKVDLTSKNNAATQLYHAGLLSAKEYSNITARIKANNTGVGSTKGTVAQVSSIDQQLQSTRGADGYIDPNVYKGYFDWWLSQGYTAASFLSNFPPKTMVNPANTWIYPYLKAKAPTGTTFG